MNPPPISFRVYASTTPQGYRLLLEDASNDIAGMARLVLQRAQEHWRELEKHVQWCDERIAAHQKDDEQVQRAAELKGVGPLTASAVVATVGDFKQFKNGAQFGAWLGLTPKQNSSGGKTSLGSITAYSGERDR